MEMEASMSEVEKKWFFEESGNRQGPHTADEIIERIRSGKISYGSLVWAQGLKDWIPIERSELSSHLNAEVPPPLRGAHVENSFLWLAAFAPTIGVFIEWLVALTQYDDSEAAFSSTMMGEFFYITIALNIAFCMVDERILKRAGYDADRLFKWTLIVPAYLYKRAAVTSQKQWFLAVWIACYFIVLAASFGWEQEETVDDAPTKAEVLQSMSGVYKIQASGALVVISSDERKFNIAVNGEILEPRSFEVSEVDRAVNLEFVDDSGAPVVWTLRKVWHENVNGYVLILSTHTGDQAPLSYIRQPTKVDLEIFKTAAPERNDEEESSNTQNSSHIGQCVSPKTKMVSGSLAFIKPVHIYASPSMTAENRVLDTFESYTINDEASGGFIQLVGTPGWEETPNPNAGVVVGWALAEDFEFQALRNCN
jgi:hypothetical protein